MKKIILLSMFIFFMANFMIGCKKSSNSLLNHVPGMEGIRYWTGTELFLPDSIYNNISDTFAINVINDKTIYFNDYLINGLMDTLTYNSTASNDTILFESQTFGVYALNIDITVTYDYLSNSIIYSEIGFSPGGGSYQINLHTP